MKLTIGRPRAAALTLVVATALLAGCSRPAPATPAATPVAEKQVQVKTAPVQRGDLVSTLSYSGDVKSKANLTIVPKASGRVEKLSVDVGSRVKAGDVIAELDKDTTRLAVRQAEAQLAAAQARLETMKIGARPEAVEQAEANTRAARARTASLEAGPRAENVTQAQVQADNARQRLAALEKGRDEGIARADAAVAAAKAQLDATLKGPTPAEVQAKQMAVAQARKNLEASQVQRDGVCGFGHSTPCDNARAGVLQAEAAMRQADQQVRVFTQPATPETVAQLQAAIDTARQQAELARRPAGELDLAAQQAQIRAADAGVAAAQRPVVSGDIEAARAQAEAAAAGAALTANPYTKEDVEAAQAQVAQAQAAVDLNKAQLKETTVVAPVDGVVSDRLIVVGAVASPATPIVAIVSPELEITVAVEETQLARVQAGQAAQIAVSAYPGQTFNGKVAVISPTIDPKSRTAQVKVQPDQDAVGKLRPGMFAQVSLVTEKKTAVLTIPRSALLPGSEPAVMAVVDGQLKRVPVQIGSRGGDQIEVTAGLKEGDQVALDALDLREGDRVAVASRA
ncbi:MAG TPA: efflux RND transporter periplasmic adaptor subunit [Chloroflexota bacterium]